MWPNLHKGIYEINLLVNELEQMQFLILPGNKIPIISLRTYKILAFIWGCIHWRGSLIGDQKNFKTSLLNTKNVSTIQKICDTFLMFLGS